jgi:DHA1 family inner membrane transport protein
VCCDAAVTHSHPLVQNLNEIAPSKARLVAVPAALAITAFCFVTTEQLPVGLLDLIANEFHTSVSTTGLLVAGYGLTVAVVSLPLTHVTRRIPRRHLLSGVLAIFVLASLVSATASQFEVLAAARIVTAATQAVFWSVMPAIVAGLFPAHARGRGMALVFAGASLSSVLGVPAAIWLGQQASWRAAFLAVSGLGVVTLIVIVTIVPTTDPGKSLAATGLQPHLRRFLVLVTTTAVTITGLFVAQTYTVDFIAKVSGFDSSAVSGLMLLRGLAGLAGLATGSVIVDKRPRLAIIAPIALLTASLVGLYLFGTSQPAAVAMIGLSGFAMGGLPSAFQHRVLQVAPGSSDLASAGNGAAFNVGIAAGAALGGLVIRLSNVHMTALVGAALTTIGLAVFLSERFIGHHPKTSVPSSGPVYVR